MHERIKLQSLIKELFSEYLLIDICEKGSLFLANKILKKENPNKEAVLDNLSLFLINKTWPNMKEEKHKIFFKNIINSLRKNNITYKIIKK